MKKKNLAAMGLAGIMAVGMCMPVMAASAGDNNVPVTMTVDESYDVTIPASITVQSTDADVTIEFSVLTKPLVEVGKSVKVKVVDPELTLATGSKPNTAEYKMSISTDGTSSASANTVLGTFDGTSVGGTKATAHLITTADSVLTNSGEYTGTAVFNIAVE